MPDYDFSTSRLGIFSHLWSVWNSWLLTSLPFFKIYLFCNYALSLCSQDNPTVVVEDLRLCTVKHCEDIERRFCFEVVSPTKWVWICISNHEKKIGRRMGRWSSAISSDAMGADSSCVVCVFAPQELHDAGWLRKAATGLDQSRPEQHRHSVPRQGRWRRGKIRTPYHWIHSCFVM